MLQVLTQLADRGECGSLDPNALMDWVRQAQRANQARNQVIHSPWVTTEDDGLAFVLTNGSMKPLQRSEDELRRDIESLTQAVVSAIELL